jgi:cysteine-rich repeat protein
MRHSHHFECVLIAVAIVAGSCSSPDDVPGLETSGRVDLALTSTPADVRCVRVVVAGRVLQAERRFDTTPGQTLATSLTGLPIGPVALGADAFGGSCGTVTPSSMPTWTSDPIELTLIAGQAMAVTLNMRRPGRIDVTLDFMDAATPGLCGNGMITAPEQCDDGNTRAGDGCTSSCAIEPGFSCPTPGQPCVVASMCGNGVVSGSEQCDDGNTRAGDGCTSSCAIEPGFSCPTPGQPCVVASMCGNGVVSGSEQCDDGNTRTGDGCTSACAIEPGFTCPTPGQPCLTTSSGLVLISQDIGAVAATGSWNLSSGTHTVRGSGADIWGTADEFRFSYQSVSGNATITARVSSVQNVNAWTKAGLMIREGTAPNAPYVAALVTPTPANQYRFQARSALGGSATSSGNGAGTLPVWLRLVRSNTTITAFYSTNGASWIQYGSATVSLASTVHFGLAITSHADGTLAQATFDSVTITQP